MKSPRRMGEEKLKGKMGCREGLKSRNLIKELALYKGKWGIQSQQILACFWYDTCHFGWTVHFNNLSMDWFQGRFTGRRSDFPLNHSIESDKILSQCHQGFSSMVSPLHSMHPDRPSATPVWKKTSEGVPKHSPPVFSPSYNQGIPQ